MDEFVRELRTIGAVCRALLPACRAQHRRLAAPLQLSQRRECVRRTDVFISGRLFCGRHRQNSHWRGLERFCSANRNLRCALWLVFDAGGLRALGVIIFVVPALVFLLYLDMARQSWQRHDENFLATTEGLSWSVNGRERLFAAWDELQILHVVARGRLIALPSYRLQSARGEFNWNNGLCAASQLRRTCFERAPQLKRQVQARLSEELNLMRDEPGRSFSSSISRRAVGARCCGCARSCASPVVSP